MSDAAAPAATAAAAGAAAPAVAEVPHPSGLTLDQRFELVRSVGEECISDVELRNLLAKKPVVRCYDGFEPSGRMHIAQGLFKAINVNKCTAAGCQFVFWVADWFALMNDKMGGELEKIRVVGQYLVEVWKAGGMNMDNVVFKWSSDEINGDPKTYWQRVLDIGRRNTMARMKKCCQIMGRTEGGLSAAQILYPLMQCADIFFLQADICQLGLDQRKVNMLAREYCDLAGRKLKPVILSHHMMSGLLQGQGKSSKSKPDSAIFMEDSAEEVERKITNAYCPKVRQVREEIADDGALAASDDRNPVLDYLNCIVFSNPTPQTFVAGGTTFTSYQQVEDAFIEGRLLEADLKAGLIVALNGLIEPVRRHFETNPEARILMEKVCSYRTGGAAPTVAPVEAGVDPATWTPCAVAWLPATLRMPLSDAAALVDSFKRFVAEFPGGRAILMQPHWTAFVLSELGGEEKDIAAALEYHWQLLQTLGLPANVEKVLQVDELVKNPNSYWLDVIAAGRKFNLQDIEGLWGGGAVSLVNAGQVIAPLMRVADVAMLKATHLLCNGADEGINALPGKFFSPAAVAAAADGGASAAAASPLTVVPLRFTFPRQLCDPRAAATTADDRLFIDDGDLDIRRKIKRAFAAPTDPNSPVIEVAGAWLREDPSRVVAIKRPEANGGDVNYTNIEALVADYAAGSLHPGDLKDAVTQLLLLRTTEIRAAAKKLDKLASVLRTAEKRAAKK